MKSTRTRTIEVAPQRRLRFTQICAYD